MKQKILIAPSILAANPANLEGEAKRVEKAGADLLHVDVMDGRFLPRSVFGVDVVKRLRKATKLPLDVHLMVVEPARHVKEYAQAGASRICVHAEAGAAGEVLEALKLARKSKCKAGLAIRPATPLGFVDRRLLEQSDFVVPMSVEPGAAGQSFMPEVLAKIDALNLLLKKMRLKKELEADGGINSSSARFVVERGVSVLVAGAAVFKAMDARAAIRQLRESALLERKKV